jgi:hypothetical protein
MCAVHFHSSFCNARRSSPRTIAAFGAALASEGDAPQLIEFAGLPRQLDEDLEPPGAQDEQRQACKGA